MFEVLMDDGLSFCVLKFGCLPAITSTTFLNALVLVLNCLEFILSFNKTFLPVLNISSSDIVPLNMLTCCKWNIKIINVMSNKTQCWLYLMLIFHMIYLHLTFQWSDKHLHNYCLWIYFPLYIHTSNIYIQILI